MSFLELKNRLHFWLATTPTREIWQFFSKKNCQNLVTRKPEKKNTHTHTHKVFKTILKEKKKKKREKKPAD
jgi:hypothetical protein